MNVANFINSGAFNSPVLFTSNVRNTASKNCCRRFTAASSITTFTSPTPSPRSCRAMLRAALRRRHSLTKKKVAQRSVTPVIVKPMTRPVEDADLGSGSAGAMKVAALSEIVKEPEHSQDTHSTASISSLVSRPQSDHLPSASENTKHKGHAAWTSSNSSSANDTTQGSTINSVAAVAPHCSTFTVLTVASFATVYTPSASQKNGLLARQAVCMTSAVLQSASLLPTPPPPCVSDATDAAGKRTLPTTTSPAEPAALRREPKRSMSEPWTSTSPPAARTSVAASNKKACIVRYASSA
mmetsp:Transcript_62026/g.179847  ORF Transcript_62026/g.179847 Transcript_62026/m.179847 type:complete len:297 (+) Transcript_62026:851-1741(+)